MKYGEKLENESVPEWSLHNIDYNSLKHQIKAHTTRDQATAIAIPGHADQVLTKFEDAFYYELRKQHDRVDLFVTSKADEISRRLRHLSEQVQSLLLRTTRRSRDRLSIKTQRRFLRYHLQVQRCGDEIHALVRFSKAQTIAFRKILKKYKKWTGSTTLSARFKETVLQNPKSFTQRDFTHLQAAYDDLLHTLNAATPPVDSDTESPTAESSSGPHFLPDSPTRARDFAPGAINTTQDNKTPTGYWNEYDYGSEAGDYDANGGFVIYVDPDDGLKGFPGMATLVTFFRVPVDRLRGWFSGRGNGKEREGDPLLRSGLLGGGYGTNSSTPVSPTTPVAGDGQDEQTDPEEAYASSGEFPVGYAAHYAALPSIEEQRVTRYRERVLFWGVLASFGVALLLLGVSFVLLMVGRHKLRVEVDAGVTVGVVASLGCACVGLVMALSRHDPLSWVNGFALWTTFGGLCVLNGMVLVIVAGNVSL